MFGLGYQIPQGLSEDQILSLGKLEHMEDRRWHHLEFVTIQPL